MENEKQKKLKITRIEREIESIKSDFQDFLESTPPHMSLPVYEPFIPQEYKPALFGDYFGISLAIEEIRILQQLSRTLNCPLPPLLANEYPDNMDSMVQSPDDLDDLEDQNLPFKRGVIIQNGHVVKMITKARIEDSIIFHPLDPAIGKLRFLTEINCFGHRYDIASYNSLPENERYAVWEIIHNLYFPPNNLSWPFSIENGHIVEITINDVYLRVVPESIGNFAMLRKLSLHGAFSYSLPESIGLLDNLQEIWITRHELNTLPESIGRLNNLNVLTVVDRNTLSPSNQSFTVSFSIPPSLSNLFSLECLNLSGNQISLVSENMGELIGLKELYLSGNHFSQVPNGLAQLVNLRLLDLSYTRISSVPSWIDRLSSLQVLILSNTDIAYLPLALCTLSNLHTLDISGCREFAKNFSENADVLLSLKQLGKLSIPTPETSNLYPTFMLDLHAETEISGNSSNFDLNEAFPSILKKIREGRPLSWIERHHPRLGLWVSRIEDECIETMKEPTSEQLVKNNAAAILQFLKTQNFLLHSTQNSNSLLL